MVGSASSVPARLAFSAAHFLKKRGYDNVTVLELGGPRRRQMSHAQLRRSFV